MSKNSHSLETTLLRIAEALERLSPAEPPLPKFEAAEAFIWQTDENRFAPVAHVNRMPIALLKSVDRMRDILLANTENFARGLPANNALLWGSRGMGKSSLVKAVHAEVAARQEKAALKLIEIHREDISESAPVPVMAAGPPAAFHRFLRRPFFRCRRYVLQGFEGCPRRRDRRPAGERRILCHIEPPS